MVRSPFSVHRVYRLATYDIFLGTSGWHRILYGDAFEGSGQNKKSMALLPKEASGLCPGYYFCAFRIFFLLSFGLAYGRFAARNDSAIPA